MSQFKQYLQYEKEIAEAKIEIINRHLKGERPRPSRRTSKIDIAWKVLKAARRPLHVSEIIRNARRDFGVDLDRDSIVSGMIKKVKAEKLFARTAPNTFALKEYDQE